MTNFSSSRQRLDGGRGLIVLKGEVDIYTAPRFKDDLLALIDEGATDILVDLTRVEFIDSTALGVLIGGVKRLHTLGGRLLLIADSRPVLKILAITGLDKVFAVYPDREKALAAL
ncbi:MAG TPA: STAS domain-containing protein [Thermoleophilia bacterium]|nr:STAS domain-containing protein [Thermoleophilia bacterium]